MIIGGIIDKMEKILKIVIVLCLSFVTCIHFRDVKAKTEEEIDYSQGVKIGSTIYDYDENGNVIKRVVNDDETITVEELLYGNNYGQGGDENISLMTLNDENPSQTNNDNEENVEPIVEYQYTLINLKEDNSQEIIKKFINYEDVLKEYDKSVTNDETKNYCIIDNNGNYLKVKYGVVKFKSVVSNGYIKNISYKNAKTGDSGYLNPAYGFDAAYLGTENGKVRFVIAGVEGLVAESLVEIQPYADKTTFVSYYKIDNDKLLHRIKYKNNEGSTGYSGSYINGYINDSLKLKPSTVYYSYDGHYFFTDYFDMIDAYRSGDMGDAVNKKPYYNYYQFLSHRSNIMYTSEQLNKYFEYKIGNKNSVMKNTGEYFVENQKLYGANALLTIGVAANESAWGTSSYAVKRNNLFGHAAYDSNPDNATGYESVNDSIKYHTQIYVSKNYVSPTIWKDGKVVLGSTYFGPNLGDKASGMNIKYASDPFWGEKNALTCYLINDYFKKEDYGRYTIGMKNVTGVLNVRKEADPNSTLLYQTEEIQDVPFIILEQVKGVKVNGSNIWYKIQSDAPLTEDRKSYTTTNNTYTYNYNVSYGYVHSSYVDIVFEGNGKMPVEKEEEKPVEKPTVPETPTTPEKPTTPTQPETPKCEHTKTTIINKKDSTCTHEGYSGDTKCEKCNEIIKKGNTIPLKAHTYVEGKCKCGAEDPNYVPPFPTGDVNGDYKITSMDYIKIKNHLMKSKTMSNDEYKRADVSGDEKVTSLDYIKVKNHIMGTSQL